jgi:hypothetical protein
MIKSLGIMPTRRDACAALLLAASPVAAASEAFAKSVNDALIGCRRLKVDLDFNRPNGQGEDNPYFKRYIDARLQQLGIVDDPNASLIEGMISITYSRKLVPAVSDDACVFGVQFSFQQLVRIRGMQFTSGATTYMLVDYGFDPTGALFEPFKNMTTKFMNAFERDWRSVNS